MNHESEGDGSGDTESRGERLDYIHALQSANEALHRRAQLAEGRAERAEKALQRFTSVNTWLNYYRLRRAEGEATSRPCPAKVDMPAGVEPCVLVVHTDAWPHITKFGMDEWVRTIEGNASDWRPVWAGAEGNGS